MSAASPLVVDPSARAAADHAIAVFEAGVRAVRADTLVRSALRLESGVLWVAGEPTPLDPWGSVRVAGAGKAAAAMAQAVEEVLGDRIAEGVAVTKHGHALPTRRIRLLEAGHPVPDTGSLEAGRAVLDLAARSGERDLLVFLLSGGASALMESPADGVTLEDLQQTTSLLLRSGAGIDEVNAVRACLSRVKAGGVARAAGRGRVVCLVLSDVLGSPLGVIGSGPCLDLPASPEAARAAIERRGLADRIPASVKAALERPPAAGAGRTLNVRHVILGDIWTALEAAREEAARRGLRAGILTGWLQGEAREAGTVLGGIARDMHRAGHGFDCLLAGGETTVTVRGQGRGGRSQELAAAASRLLEGAPGVALLAAGTDGTDGPTEAAGALVDCGTLARALAAGAGLEDALASSDTLRFHQAAGSLLATGPTHTNVGDLVVLVRDTGR